MSLYRLKLHKETSFEVLGAIFSTQMEISSPLLMDTKLVSSPICSVQARVQLVSPNNTSTQQQTVYSPLFTSSRKQNNDTTSHGQGPVRPSGTFNCMQSTGWIFYLPLHPSFSYTLNKDKDQPMVLTGQNSNHLHHP